LFYDLKPSSFDDNRKPSITVKVQSIVGRASARQYINSIDTTTDGINTDLQRQEPAADRHRLKVHVYSFNKVRLKLIMN